ncbi:MAG: ABC transporter permease [Candidatus Goldiibacteriota bacterium]
MEQNRAGFIFIIPGELSSSLKKNKHVEVRLIADGSDSNQSLISLNRAAMIITEFSRDVFKQDLERMKKKTGPVPSIGAQERIWYNPGLKSANTMVPGVIGMILLIVTLVVTAVSIVREKENGNIEQITVTPIKPYQIILGKTMPYAGLGFVNIISTVLTGMIVFGIPFEGSFILLILLSVFMILASIGTGVLISTVSATQQQAMLSAMFIILPNILLSGFVFPIKNMPEILQYFTYLLPLRYYMEIIRGIFLKGIGFEALVPQTVMLFVFGAVLLTAAAKMFRKTVR